MAKNPEATAEDVSIPTTVDKTGAPTVSTPVEDTTIIRRPGYDQNTGTFTV